MALIPQNDEQIVNTLRPLANEYNIRSIVFREKNLDRFISRPSIHSCPSGRAVRERGR
jgi:hypothetical protein